MILITGGAGYIGSHTLVELLNNDRDVVVVDNLSNSSHEALKRVERITQRNVMFVEADVCDAKAMDDVFRFYPITSVIHFAGLKAVGESVAKPVEYYDTNVVGTHTLLKTMAKYDVRRLVFSSSATVYGDPAHTPITESAPIGATTNPYGTSKYLVERILKDVAASDERWRIATLRYFNPVGAHESGLIGEDPNGIPNNLVPYIAQVAVGRLEQLSVYGDDYPTRDGTGVRDYIHVCDLARGHLSALDYLDCARGYHTFNLGTGTGSTVLEVIKAFEQASGQSVPYKIVHRRPGDIAACFAEPSLAKHSLNWAAEHGLERMMQDTWRWQQQNPQGYKS
ncbi:UDP-glucose 4-epimerase GalE [Idiomarina sp. MD25a]|uniref:UDP-glucose 4-epimerase GalE n=1 Tax=Idiomarina sp. MD25a TaxID=1889913 RepID=UPI0008F85AB7|nr:UDP-glucose 4-epimerase GalE [Idiomarina sp. MD25a]OIM99628.1 UDP-glucose 4-epimerase GalE [Idiomarina sp. MD25a]